MDELTRRKRLMDPEHLVEVVRELPEGTVVGFEPTAAHLAAHVGTITPDDRGHVAAIVGLRAGRGWQAIGVHLVAPSEDDPDLDAPLAAVLDRSGRLAVRVHPNGSHPNGSHPNALVVDALHRAFGLPSPGPAPRAVDAALWVWAHAIVGAVLGGGRPGWAEVVGLHPGAPSRAGRPGPGPSIETVVEATRRCAATFDWERVHGRAVAGSGALPPGLDEHEARWMDTTMYARWTLSTLVDAAAALELLRTTGLVEAATGLAAVIEALDPAAEELDDPGLPRHAS